MKDTMLFHRRFFGKSILRRSRNLTHIATSFYVGGAAQAD
ncbi:hypothetical protein SXCC_00782 [Gluconacetobacter sp. SXCC-1]|nr:hypothetical protein SXCC_00782 [Gluconacetobacter sp. SXCC-1]